MIRQPSSVIIAEPSGSGKSELLEKWLRYQNMFQVKPKTVVYVYQRWQPQAYCGFQVDVMFVLMPGPGSSHHKKKTQSWSSVSGSRKQEKTMHRHHQKQRCLMLCLRHCHHVSALP